NRLRSSYSFQSSETKEPKIRWFVDPTPDLSGSDCCYSDGSPTRSEIRLSNITSQHEDENQNQRRQKIAAMEGVAALAAAVPDTDAVVDTDAAGWTTGLGVDE
ncbi:hypothetical protein Vafri_1830, partial [Volvox africanus]